MKGLETTTERLFAANLEGKEICSSCEDVCLYNFPDTDAWKTIYGSERSKRIGILTGNVLISTTKIFDDGYVFLVNVYLEIKVDKKITGNKRKEIFYLRWSRLPVARVRKLTLVSTK